MDFGQPDPFPSLEGHPGAKGVPVATASHQLQPESMGRVLPPTEILDPGQGKSPIVAAGDFEGVFVSQSFAQRVYRCTTLSNLRRAKSACEPKDRRGIAPLTDEGDARSRLAFSRRAR